jgi:hypothetical protein
MVMELSNSIPLFEEIVSQDSYLFRASKWALVNTDQLYNNIKEVVEGGQQFSELVSYFHSEQA